ncbi:sensor histidine kinase [Cellulomonas hominis]|uniref:sensor histidine kinase n=1 Tax=Cellulomonas hominis TaxID=156981 RepID=UPI001B9469DD|nr:sensor histidine kinase [Cellulomonas hominis]VTR78390.1 Sensor histidine kinase DesK [Cellulomonas hominis]
MLRSDGDTAGPVPSVVEDPDAPGWHRPPLTDDQRRYDALLAAGLLIGAVLSLALGQTAGMYDEPAEGWVGVLMLLAITAPLALRRRWPSAVAVVVAVAFIVSAELQVPETLFANIALFMALYTVGAWEPRRTRAAWVRAVVVVAMFVWLLIAMFEAVTDPEGIEGFSNAGAFSPLVAYLLIQLLTNVLYFAGSWWFGEHAWNAARERARTDWRGRQLVGERRRVEEQAVAIERLRLARELHDAVAHHVSMMGVQAAAARVVLGSDPERAAAALEQVEDSAREAVDELHGLLSTLRESGTDAETSAVGSLSVDRLPELVQQATDTGLAARFQVVGEPVRVPPLTSLNLYRICQEALTNVRKHAGAGARVDVRLRYDTDAVELEIADDGTGGRRSGRTTSGGLGLVGMRERVAADGGTLETGARGRGGYLVRARVPLAPRTGGAR